METLTSILTYTCTLMGLSAMVIGGLFVIFVLAIAALVLAGALLEMIWKKGES